MTMRCAFRASTLSWNSRSKPLVTAMTTTSEATPSTTPIVDTVVKTENVRSRNATTATRPPARTASTAAVSVARQRPCASAKSPNPAAISTNPRTRAAGPPAEPAPAVQVAHAHQPFQPQREQLAQAPSQQCGQGSLDQGLAVGRRNGRPRRRGADGADQDQPDDRAGAHSLPREP